MCLGDVPFNTSPFQPDFSDIPQILPNSPELDSNAWDSLIAPLLDIPSRNTNSAQKRPRPPPTLPPTACQCPCAALHLAAAAAKQRKCCGGNCSCPPGQCRCTQTAVPTRFPCCANPADLVADNVAAALSITSPTHPAVRQSLSASCCASQPPQPQTDPLLRTTNPQLIPSEPSHPPQPIPQMCCASPENSPPIQTYPLHPDKDRHHPPPEKDPPPIRQSQLPSQPAVPNSYDVPLAQQSVHSPSQVIQTQLPNDLSGQRLQPLATPQPSDTPVVQPQQQIQSQCSECSGKESTNGHPLASKNSTTSAVMVQLYPPTASPSSRPSNGVPQPVPVNGHVDHAQASEPSANFIFDEAALRSFPDETATTISTQRAEKQPTGNKAGQPARGRDRGQSRGGGGGGRHRGSGRGRGSGRRSVRALSFPESKGSSVPTAIVPSAVESVPSAVEERSREFACSQCPSTFFFKQNRDRHINEVHLGRRPHKCYYSGCESKFKNRSGLKQHIRTVHEKARPFKCTLCSSAFGQRNHLSQHVLVVHNKVKMFKCDLCSMAFSNVGNRTQHMKRRHGEKSGLVKEDASAAITSNDVPGPDS